MDAARDVLLSVIEDFEEFLDRLESRREALEELKDELLIFSDREFMDSIRQGLADLDKRETIKCESEEEMDRFSIDMSWKAEFTKEFVRTMGKVKRKDADLFHRLEEKIKEIVEQPERYKPPKKQPRWIEKGTSHAFCYHFQNRRGHRCIHPFQAS